MIVVEIELLAGKYIAQGEGEKPEWPPHPARLFAAMVSEYHRGGFHEADSDEERESLEWLQNQDPPEIHFPNPVKRTEVTKYVVVNDRKKDEVVNTQDQKKSKKVPTVIPEDNSVYFVWDVKEEEKDKAEGIKNLSQNISYLGRSTSTVRINASFEGEFIEQDDFNTICHNEEYSPEYSIRAPRENEIEVLERQYENNSDVTPSAGRRASYIEPPEGEVSSSVFGEVYVMKRTEGSLPPIEQFFKVSDIAKNAVNSIAEDPVPSVISGHNEDGSPFEDTHVGYIPLPHVSDEYGDGTIFGVGVVVPEGIEEINRNILLKSLGELDTLTLGKLGEVGLKHDPSPDLKTLDKDQYVTRSRKWATVTPYIFGRYPRKKSKTEIVADSCSYIGLPYPEEIETRKTSPLTGVPQTQDFDFKDAHFKDKMKRHLVLEFNEPIEGPVILGAGRYFGSGLMKPVREDQI